jgi:hypothetical protein
VALGPGRASFGLEHVAEVVVGGGVVGIDREGALEGLGRLARPALLHEHDAVVVVGFGQARAEGHRGAIVLLRLVPAAEPAVDRDQVGVGLGERGVRLQGGLVLAPRALGVARFPEADALGQECEGARLEPASIRCVS